MTHEYDVALSFAGEDRQYVATVARILNARGCRVFFDEYEVVDLWGKDLYQHLADVYEKRARHCIIFASQAYAAKAWPKHELRSAQARAVRQAEEYILPARFDDTEIPGIPPTIKYVDLRNFTPEELCDLIIAKLRHPRGIDSTRHDEPTPDPSAPDGAPDSRTLRIARNGNDASQFLRDVTIPDGARIRIGSTVSKIWEIQNAGSVVWEKRFLQREGPHGDPRRLQSPERVPVPRTEPLGRCRLEVTLKMPNEPGSQFAEWKMVMDDGTYCFPESSGIWVSVDVIY